MSNLVTSYRKVVHWWDYIRARRTMSIYIGSAFRLAVYVSICSIGEVPQLNSGHSWPEAFSKYQLCLPFMVAI